MRLTLLGGFTLIGERGEQDHTQRRLGRMKDATPNAQNNSVLRIVMFMHFRVSVGRCHRAAWDENEDIDKQITEDEHCRQLSLQEWRSWRARSASQLREPSRRCRPPL